MERQKRWASVVHTPNYHTEIWVVMIYQGWNKGGG